MDEKRHFDDYEQTVGFDSDDEGHGFATAKSTRTSYSFGSPSGTICRADSILKRADSRRRTRNATTRHKAVTPLDFTGVWLLERVEGDWDAFTQEFGYGYMKRKSLAALGWGVSLMTEELKMTSGKLWLKNSTTLVTSEIDVVIDGTEQDAVDPDNVPIKLTLWWEGDSLEADSFSITTGEPLARISRTLVDARMKVVMRSIASGTAVTRFFALQ